MATTTRGSSMILPATQRRLEWGVIQFNNRLAARRIASGNLPCLRHVEKLPSRYQGEALAFPPTRAMDTQTSTHTAARHSTAVRCRAGGYNIRQTSLRLLCASSKLRISITNRKINRGNRRHRNHHNSSSRNMAPTCCTVSTSKVRHRHSTRSSRLTRHGSRQRLRSCQHNLAFHSTLHLVNQLEREFPPWFRNT